MEQLQCENGLTKFVEVHRRDGTPFIRRQIFILDESTPIRTEMMKVMAPNKFVHICSDDSPLGGRWSQKALKSKTFLLVSFIFAPLFVEYRLTEFQSLLCCYMTYMLSMCQTQCNKQTKRGKNKNGKRNKISLHFILLK